MSDRSRLRLVVLRVLVISLLATLLGRLWYLQVLAGPQYQQAAADNQVRDIVAAAPRGEIVDDRGRRWATNRTALVVSVDRVALLRQKDGGQAVLDRLAKLLGVHYSSLKAKIQLCGPGAPHGCWNGSPYEPIPVSQLKDDVTSTRLALQILERKEDFPGVSAELGAVRDYTKPGGALASQVLGYLAPITLDELKRLPKTQQDARRSDLVGRSGLEQQYDAFLRGQPGVTQVAVDHLGAVTSTLSRTTPQPGDEVVTSLDAGVQAALEKSLADAVARARHTAVKKGGGPADFAAGVVLDAQSGHVVAMASYPSYDPNVFVGGISEHDYQALQRAPGTPLLDKAYASAYPPGSTFKLISTSGLVTDGIASLSGSYDCSSSVKVGGRDFHNFESESLGYIDLHTTIVKSCDTVYYGLANQDWIRDNRLVGDRKRPVEGVQRVARAFGLGVPALVDLPGASSGHIADRNNQKLRWEQLKKDWCAGAKKRPKGSYLQLIDQENCTDGWRFNPGDQLNEDIGQGSVLASPLQMAVAYAALANGGTVFEPRLVKAIVAPDGTLVRNVPAPVRGHLPVSPGALDYIRNAMYDVPLKGTAQDAFKGFPMAQVRVGGKTGTAEVDQQHGYATAWFASFAGLASDPKPRFVTVIMVDRGGQGGVVAAPSVREVWDSVFGLERHPAAFPTGEPPAGLPRIAVLTGASPSASPAPSPSSTHALGDLFGPPGLAVRREDA
ncbi:MAG: penicillin-binding protein 2 [Frankiaceae bacterium]|nr:penicillin-binding protein 2 [Frankiaceae bacterium]